MKDGYNTAKKTPLDTSTYRDTQNDGVFDGASYTPVVGGPVYSGGMPDANITSRSLNGNSTAGVISKPSFDGGMPNNIIGTMSADVTNSEASGEANISASSENKSAQYKYPSKSQDAGAGGSQYQTPQ